MGKGRRGAGRERGRETHMMRMNLKERREGRREGKEVGIWGEKLRTSKPYKVSEVQCSLHQA